MTIILFLALAILASHAYALSGFGSKPIAIAKTSGLDDAMKCRCGSDVVYGNCCQPYHMMKTPITNPIDLIKARYSAYAMNDMEFIIHTTSPTSNDYEHYMSSITSKEKTIRRWVKDLRFNFINFHMIRMEVVNSQVHAKNAQVTFRQLSIRKDDNLMYPTEETSTLVMSSEGVWLYEKGDVQRPTPEIAQEMMEKWPDLSGLELMMPQKETGKPRKQ
jgi:SEC-C motif-containing protein